jgi:hypothetical protein
VDQRFVDMPPGLMSTGPSDCAIQLSPEMGRPSGVEIILRPRSTSSSPSVESENIGDKKGNHCLSPIDIDIFRIDVYAGAVEIILRPRSTSSWSDYFLLRN